MTPSSDSPAFHAVDHQLVDRIISGDAKVWHRFVNDYQRIVRSRVADVASAFGRGQDDGAIDDATVEVFAALVNHDAAPLRVYQGNSSLLTFIAVIATRSATRYFARNRLVAHARGDDAPGPPEQDRVRRKDKASWQSGAGQQPVHGFDADQQRRIESLLDRLPPNQRSVVALFHLQGQSYAEISQKLEMPIESVGAILRQGELSLRTWMEDVS